MRREVSEGNQPGHSAWCLCSGGYRDVPRKAKREAKADRPRHRRGDGGGYSRQAVYPGAVPPPVILGRIPPTSLHVSSLVDTAECPDSYSANGSAARPTSLPSTIALILLETVHILGFDKPWRRDTACRVPTSLPRNDTSRSACSLLDSCKCRG